MFEKLKATFGKLRSAQRLLKNPEFSAIMRHPKVKVVLGDPEFRGLMSSKNMTKIPTHPKFMTLMQDPEVAALFSKIKLHTLLDS